MGDAVKIPGFGLDGTWCGRENSLTAAQIVFDGVIVGRTGDFSSLCNGEWHLDKGRLLYQAYLYAKSQNRLDEFMKGLIQFDNGWHEDLISILHDKMSLKEEADDLTMKYGCSNRSTIQPGRELDFDGYNTAAPRAHHCFFPSIGYGKKYVLSVVSEHYNPSELREITQFFKKHESHAELSLLSLSEARQLPRFRDLTPRELPKWSLTVYGHEIGKGQGIPKVGEIEKLYSGMQYGGAEFAWKKVDGAIPENPDISIKVPSYFSEEMTENFIRKLRGLFEEANAGVAKNVFRLVGNLQIYYVSTERPLSEIDLSYEQKQEKQLAFFGTVLREREGLVGGLATRLARPAGIYSKLSHSLYVMGYAGDFFLIQSYERWTMIHEWMHAVIFSLRSQDAGSLPWLKRYLDQKRQNDPPSEKEGLSRWPTPYSTTAGDEFLAEAFTAYLLGGKSAKRLEITDPLIYAVAERLFRSKNPGPELLLNVDDLAAQMGIKVPGVMDTGWQWGVNAGFLKNVFEAGTTTGWSGELFSGARLRLDAAVQVVPQEPAVRLTLRPEAAISMTDFLMLSAGLEAGARYHFGEGVDLYNRGFAGIEILFPHVWTQLGIGLSSPLTHWNPQPFFHLEKRFSF